MHNRLLTIAKVGTYLILAITVIVLILSPITHLPPYYPWKSGTRLKCEVPYSNHKDVKIEKIILEAEAWDEMAVSVEGELSFAPTKEMFYLRDGMFTLPLLTYRCENVNNLQLPTFVAVDGTVAIVDGQSILIADGIKETVPNWAFVNFFSGAYGSGIVFMLSMILFLRRRRRNNIARG